MCIRDRSFFSFFFFHSAPSTVMISVLFMPGFASRTRAVLALIKRLYSVGARFSPSFFFFFLPFLPYERRTHGWGKRTDGKSARAERSSKCLPTLDARAENLAAPRGTRGVLDRSTLSPNASPVRGGLPRRARMPRLSAPVLPASTFPESPPSACASAGGSASNLGVSPLSSAPRSVEPALLAARPRS